MKLKLDANGVPVLVNGMPVYVYADGREVPFDAPAAMTRISELQNEAKGHREGKEAAELRLKGFDGITDPEKARKALELVQNIDDKKLVDAGKVEEIKRAATAAYEEKLRAQSESTAAQIKDWQVKATTFEQQLHAEIVGGSFARSRFIADKVAIPADMLQSKFGAHFKVENGKLSANDAAGNRIYSLERPGQDPTFDEAIEVIVNAYPSKAQILKGSGHQGSGSNGNGGGTNNAGKKTITRTAFEALAPGERAASLKDTVLVDG